MRTNKYFFIKISYILIALCLLSACSTNTLFGNLNTPPTESLFGNPLPYPASYYLAKAESSSSPAKEKYQLLAVQAMLQKGQVTEAQEAIDNIRAHKLPPPLVIQKQLLNARIEVVQNNTSEAITTLKNLEHTQSLDNNNQIEFKRIMAAAYTRSGNYLAAVQERISLNRYLSGNALKQNQRAIWSTLRNIPLDQLQSMQGSDLVANNQTLKGWVQLAYIAKTYSNNNQMLNQQINNWRSQYPNHPANQFLPNDTSDANHFFQNQNNGHIVMLLPLRGKYAKASKAIRNGLMTAFYNAQKRKPNEEDVTVYDTSTGNITALYKKAIDNGATFVIGPLRKNQVDTLMASGHFPVPTLALNYSRSSYASANDFYQFGLSPKDEAEQSAIKAWRDGKSRAIIITPRGSWGKNIADTFASTFEGQGGHVVDTFTYSNKQNLSHGIKRLLQVDESAARLRNLERTTHRDMNFSPRRRQDMDMFFLVASPRMAQTIHPLLKFYYAGDVPVYATSSIYTGIPSRADRDLDGIIFCDIPFVLNKSSQATKIRRNLAHLWSNNYDHYVRLYAVGMDAYALSQSPNRLQEMQQFPYRGESGDLSMDTRGRIYRQLSWAKMEHGRPVLIGNRP